MSSKKRTLKEIDDNDIENEETNAIKKRRLDVDETKISFDVRWEYHKNCQEIYEKLLEVHHVINAKLIAEYASSVKATCINCEKFQVYVDDDIEHREDHQGPVLIYEDDEVGEVHMNTSSTVKTEDNEIYYIINSHRILSGKYNAYRIVCKKCYDEKEMFCSNCKAESYWLTCEGCDKNICHEYECSNVRPDYNISNSYIACCLSCTFYFC